MPPGPNAATLAGVSTRGGLAGAGDTGGRASQGGIHPDAWGAHWDRAGPKVRGRGDVPGVARVRDELVTGEAKHGQDQHGQRGGPFDLAALALAGRQRRLQGRRRGGIAPGPLRRGPLVSQR